MPFRVALIGLALAALCLPTGAAAAGRYGTPCGTRDAKTLARTATTRIYVLEDTVYGCRRGAHRAFALGPEDTGGGAGGQESVGPIAVAGRYVAYADAESTPAYGDEGFTVRVRDLRTGRVLIATGGGMSAITQASVGSIVVDARGSAAFAWTRRAQPRGASPAGPEEHLIWRSPDCGPRLVDSAAGLDTQSLRLNGATLSWRESGMTRQAALCPARTQSGD